jgi:hypothetical protein
MAFLVIQPFFGSTLSFFRLGLFLIQVEPFVKFYLGMYFY